MKPCLDLHASPESAYTFQQRITSYTHQTTITCYPVLLYLTALIPLHWIFQLAESPMKLLQMALQMFQYMSFFFQCSINGTFPLYSITSLSDHLRCISDGPDDLRCISDDLRWSRCGARTSAGGTRSLSGAIQIVSDYLIVLDPDQGDVVMVTEC